MSLHQLLHQSESFPQTAPPLFLLTRLQFPTRLRQSHFNLPHKQLSLRPRRPEVLDESEEGVSLLGELGEGDVAALELLDALLQTALESLDFGGAGTLGGLHYGAKIRMYGT